MTLNDFMFVFGLAIVFLFILLSCVVVILVRNEEAREAQAHKSRPHKSKHRKHLAHSAS